MSRVIWLLSILFLLVLKYINTLLLWIVDHSVVNKETMRIIILVLAVALCLSVADACKYS